MKILITGGTGFIGQTLCPALLAAGHTLTVYSRHPDKVTAILGDRVTPLNCLKTLSESDYFEAIINLAGAPIFGKRWTDERKLVLLHSRIDITQDLVKFIARAQTKPEVFLSGSAIGFYGNQGDTILDETSLAKMILAASFVSNGRTRQKKPRSMVFEYANYAQAWLLAKMAVSYNR